MYSKDNFIFQMEAIALSLYIKEFSIFEKQLRAFYLTYFDLEKNPELYYFMGCHNVRNGIRIDIDSDSCEFDQIKIKDIPSKFHEYLTPTQLLKIDKKYNCKKELKNINIPSIRKTMNFEYYSVCKKLINMRNRIAHEYSSLVLNPDKDIIDLLNDEILKENFSKYFDGYDISIANDNTKTMLSNIFYLKIVSNEIKKMSK